MKTIYLIDKETNEVVREFHNVLEWDDHSVLYQAGKGRGRVFASDSEYLTDRAPEIKEPVTNEPVTNE
jgi:hypothetical protein